MLEKLKVANLDKEEHYELNKLIKEIYEKS